MDKKFTFIENPTEQISNIKDYIYRIISNWRWFVLTVVIAMGIAYYVNISTERKYGLSTTILVKEKQNPLLATGTNIAFNWGGVSDQVESIKKRLTSRSHNEEVVKELQFFIEYVQEGRFRLEDAYGRTPYVIKLQANQYQLLNTLIKIEHIDEETFNLSIDFEENGVYRLINYKDEKLERYDALEEGFSKIYKVDEYINLPFLKGQLVKTENYEFSKGTTFYIRLNTINQVVGRYRGVRANALMGTSLIELVSTGANKNRLVDYLNKTVEILAKNELNDKTNFARSTREFIDEQFRNTADSLKIIEDSIGQFKKDNLIYQLSAEGMEIFNQTVSLDKLQKELNDRIAYFRTLEQYILTHEVFTNIPAPAIINIEDRSIPVLVGELTTLSIQKEKLATEVTENHPAYIQVTSKIATTKGVLLENLSSLIKATEVSLENSRQRLRGYNSELNKLPSKEQKLLNFERKFSLTESNFRYLMQKRYEAEIAIAGSVSDIAVIDEAKDTGQGSIYPRTSFNYMVALLLGTIVPLFFIIAKEILDTHIHSSEDVERLTPIPILGIVGKKYTKSNLTIFEKPRSAVAESFRALRSNIHFMFVDKDQSSCKTILATSSVSGEGKTFISINMATVFALGNKKTILLGFDLRKPKLYKDFGDVNTKGVVNYLIEEETIDNVIRKTDVPNLDIITSGPVPPNPSELLISEKTKELINYLKTKYDVIIIDTPPIGIVSDAMEVLQFCDASIYVVRQNYSQKGMLKMINDKHEKGEIKNVSIVLNDFNVKSKYGYEYGYGYGYNGYGKYSRGYHDDFKNPWWRRLLGLKRKI